MAVWNSWQSLDDPGFFPAIPGWRYAGLGCDPGRHVQEWPGARAGKCPTEGFLSAFGRLPRSAPRSALNFECLESSWLFSSDITTALLSASEEVKQEASVEFAHRSQKVSRPIGLCG